MDKLKCPYCGKSGCLDISLKAYVPCTISKYGEVYLEDYSENRDEQIRISMADCINDEKVDAYCHNCGNVSEVAKIGYSKELGEIEVEKLKKLGE